MADQIPRAYQARAATSKVSVAKAKELSDEDLVRARDQFRAIYDDEQELRARRKSDAEYVDGVHPNGKPKRWTHADLTARGDRPTLSIDAMGGPISQVVNGIAEGKPAADMMPIGSGASDEKAEVWEGLLRNIQTTPEAEYAGAWAAKHLVEIGAGGWVITAKYPDYNGKADDPANWDMYLCREWIDNQHSVWLGKATRPDGSDRMCGFILQPLTEDLFDARYGEGEFEKNKSAWEALDSRGDKSATAWHGPKTVTVASWYRVKLEDVEIIDPTGQYAPRTVRHRIVCMSTITATHEYDYAELPIPYIPIVWGEAKRSNVDGEVDVKGMVRGMRDAQDLVNVWPSYIAETIAQSARQEVIAAEGQIDNQNKDFWDLTKRLPYRLFKPIELNGKFVDRPTIHNFEAPIQAMTLALQQAESFVRKTAGFYDADSDQTRASLSKESGVARRTRIQQGELGNSDFMRAYQFMVLLEVKILMAWAPHVYSSARVMRMTGRDEESFAAVTYFGQEQVQAAQGVAAQLPPQKGQPGVKGLYDLSDGRYDMKARIIKNPLTQRQENVEILTNVIPMLPPPMQVKALPVMLDEMEGTVMKRVAAAIRPDEQTVPIEEAQQAQQLLDEQARIINELKDKVDGKDAEIASKERIAQAEIASKERIEAMKIEIEMQRMLHESKMKEYELQMQAKQMEFDAHQAELSHERGLEAGNHQAATEYALRDTGEQADGAGV
jgi:hypothetical protein